MTAEFDTTEVKARLESLLREAFKVERLTIEDESGQHVGHKNAGSGHYHVAICAQEFAGMPRVAQHRAIYAAVAELLQNGVHALRITSKAPDE